MARNAKSKIKRTQKNYGVDLSEVVDIPTSVESFGTRKEFNEWKKKVNSLTNRSNLNYQYVKNDYGLVITKKELQQAKVYEKRAKANAKKMKAKIKDKPFWSGGVKQDITVLERNTMLQRPDILGTETVPTLNFPAIDRKSRLFNKMNNLEKRSKPDYFDKRMEQMKENYMEMMRKTFNSDADFLIEKLKDIPAQDFYEMYMMFDEIDFNHYYTEDEEGEDVGQLGMINSYIEKYKKGEVDMTLKGF